MTGPGGQYKIDNLPLGSYMVKVAHPDYKPQEKRVVLEQGKAYPNIDFDLERAEGVAFTLEEMWEIVRAKLPADVVRSFNGYIIQEMKGPKREKLFEIIKQLKANEASLKSFTVK